MKPTGVNMGAVKLQNRNAIIKYICKVGPVSRKDIANAVGLTAASVTQITTALISEGILFEQGRIGENKGAGRKKVLLEINYDAAYVFSINIEIEKTTIALTNLRGDVLALEVIPTNKAVSPNEFLMQITDTCKVLGEEHKGNIKACSVGIVGIVDKDLGISKHAYGIWNEEVKVCDFISKELKLPCTIENNVNAFAIATMLFGEGREYDNLHIIKWGPGVGSAIVIDNAIYEGRNGKASEIGHCIVDSKGKMCSCGRRGCLETKVSYNALSSLYRFEPDEFGKAYESASEEVREEFDGAISLFSIIIDNAISLLAPNRIILTGSMFKDEIIRQKVISECIGKDSKIEDRRILYSALSDKEDFIGPVARCWTLLGII